jgi:hypothetical protein
VSVAEVNQTTAEEPRLTFPTIGEWAIYLDYRTRQLLGGINSLAEHFPLVVAKICSWIGADEAEEDFELQRPPLETRFQENINGQMVYVDRSGKPLSAGK